MQDAEVLTVTLRQRRLAALRDDIDAGLRDLVAGRLVGADIDDIMARGRLLSSARDPSA